jgi:exopolysaccharide biosynthesis polyprenyl glycosylphosphotransferase
MTTINQRGSHDKPRRALSRERKHQPSTPRKPAGHRVNSDPLAAGCDAVGLAIAYLVAGVSYPAPSVVVVVVSMMLLGTYRQHLTLSVLDAFPRIAMASVLATALAVLLTSRQTTLADAAVTAALTIGVATLSRVIAYSVERTLRRRGRRRRTVVVGGGTLGHAVAENLISRPECGLEPIGIIDDAPLPETVSALSLPVVPLGGNLSQFLTEQEIDTAVIAFSQIRESDMLGILRECDRLDCEIYVVPRLWEMTAVSGEMERIGAIPVTKIRRAAHRTLAWQIKLRLGQLGAALALLALAPTLAMIALAVYISDRSAPILFRQTRVGMDGHEFEVLKFRSMKPANENESATNWNISNDSRLGTLGRILRSTSFDEMPQLWNVLRGDMTLIGPRPERPHFVQKFTGSIHNYRDRHRVPAGLTGWAAVNGLRGDTSIPDRARFDNYYIENWSLWFDVKVVLRTFVELMPTKRR